MKEKLLEIRQATLQEIYRQCIELGIDPDTFDYTQYISTDDQIAPKANLRENCKKLSIIDRKLEQL